VDTVSKEVRSRIMSAVKPYGNKTTEMIMGKLLRENGLRGYRKHWPIDGKPDFAWPRLRIALFVDGCFWHGCPRCKRIPTSNRTFWAARIGGNRRRDRRVSRSLKRAGWLVLRVWECRLQEERTMEKIRVAVLGQRDDATS
jgi:DNA mismatch endonuclease (patch repair protein)